jgi:hypothetical protein
VRDKILNASKAVGKLDLLHLLPDEVPDTMEKIDEMLSKFDVDANGIFNKDEVRAMARKF